MTRREETRAFEILGKPGPLRKRFIIAMPGQAPQAFELHLFDMPIDKRHIDCAGEPEVRRKICGGIHGPRAMARNAKPAHLKTAVPTKFEI